MVSTMEVIGVLEANPTFEVRRSPADLAIS
jgi:hypothetical protein